MTLHPDVIGIDIAKAHLDVHDKATGTTRRIANSHRATAELAGSLARLAPYNNDSGTWRGKRSIRAGRPRVRTALYMAAVSLVQSKGAITAFYNRRRAAGRPPKVALVATARKLLVTLNAIAREQKPYVQPA